MIFMFDSRRNSANANGPNVSVAFGISPRFAVPDAGTMNESQLWAKDSKVTPSVPKSAVICDIVTGIDMEFVTVKKINACTVCGIGKICKPLKLRLHVL